ncbi:MAG TPA: hypothetical protein VE944_30985 [Nostoc sp.]|uniref:hypothetical protein n=1 Tax=Nostoc sp. TaxID=1180 RepID=UPI002D5BF99B|nr:hypothetical protein [Nostoc sp.]HYX18718.1 hypothetical protein [Nostoc sp.]
MVYTQVELPPLILRHLLQRREPPQRSRSPWKATVYTQVEFLLKSQRLPGWGKTKAKTLVNQVSGEVLIIYAINILNSGGRLLNSGGRLLNSSSG